MSLTLEPTMSLSTAPTAVSSRYDDIYTRWSQQQATVEQLRNDLDTGPGDEADHATTMAQLDEQIAIADTLRTQLDQLSEAAARTLDGSYGVCESCGDTIPAERLAIFPATTQCVSCKARARS